MQTTLISSLSISPRQRHSIDTKGVEELAQSIATVGLLHAIVCRKDGDILRLIAGERRTRAVRSLAADRKVYNYDSMPVPPGEIPFILISDLSSIGYRQAELEENISRIDLSWQDRVDALNEIRALKEAQEPGTSVAQVAKEVAERTRVAPSTASGQLHRAELIGVYRDDPDVARAKDERTAYNIATRKAEEEFRGVLQRKSEKRRGEEGGRKSPHLLVHGELEKEMEKLPDSIFPCIIADPPYGIGAQGFGDAAKLGHSYDDDPKLGIHISMAILRCCYRIAQVNAHLYLFCDIENFIILRGIAEDYNWTPWRTPLIWSKGGGMGHAPDRDRGFRRTYEMILFCRKGNKSFPNIFNDLMEVPIERDLIYAAQKPERLYTQLLSYSALPGDIVLDPCCGSGTIFAAAQKLSMKAVGIERDWGALGIAQARLQELLENTGI